MASFSSSASLTDIVCFFVAIDWHIHFCPRIILQRMVCIGSVDTIYEHKIKSRDIQSHSYAGLDSLPDILVQIATKIRYSHRAGDIFSLIGRVNSAIYLALSRMDIAQPDLQARIGRVAISDLKTRTIRREFCSSEPRSIGSVCRRNYNEAE